MAVAHYLEALEWQREFIKIHAVLGGKNPHLQSFLVGGMATPIDPGPPGLDQRGNDRRNAGLDRESQRLRQQGLHSGPSCRRLLLQGLGGLRKGCRQLPRLRRVPGGRPVQLVALPALRRHPQPRPLEGRALRPLEDHRAGQALLVRVRGRATTRAFTPPGRDVAQVHRPEAALRAARHRRQVQLAQVAALRRPADGGRAPLADARRLRLGHTRGQRARGRRARRSSTSAPTPSSPPSAVSPPGASRRCSSPSRWRAGSTISAANMARRRAPHPRQLQVGTRRPGRRNARARASTRHPRGALGPLGPHQGRRDRRTTSASCPAPGTPGLATPPASAGPTRRLSSARPSPTRASRSRSSAPSTRSTRAWPAGSTSSTRSGVSSRR